MTLSDGTGWESPLLFQDGDALTSAQLRVVLSSLENKLMAIRGQDLQRDNDRFILNSDLDLGGYNLIGAGNVPIGIVNIRSKGVDGVGASSDYEAIRAAVEEVGADGHKILYFPAGEYRLNGPIQLPDGMSVFGSGPNTVIRMNSDGIVGQPGFILSGNSPSVRDMSFFDPTGDRKNGAILFRSASNPRVEKVHCNNTGVAITVNDCQNFQLSGVFVNDSKSALSVTDTEHFGVSCLYGTGLVEDGILVSGTTSANIIATHIDTAGKAGCRMTGVVSGIIQGNFTDCTEQGLYLNGCSALEISAVNADNNGRDSANTFPGIHLAGCTGVTVDSSQSRAIAGSSRQSYGVYVEGGAGCKVWANDLLPNRGPSGDKTGPEALAAEFAVLMTGSAHVEYANFQIVV